MRALLSSALLLLAVAVAAPGAQATNLVDCTVTLAGDQYFSTGDYVFGHGQLNRYGGDTSDNAAAFATCGPNPDVDCETTLAGDQATATTGYLGHGQLKVYGGDTQDNALAYRDCRLSVS